MFKLLSKPLDNPKLAKNGKLGVLASPLHLAPYTLSGKNVCPKASDGCAKACLHYAGDVRRMAGKTAARLRKTDLFWSDRQAFLFDLALDIAKLERMAKRLNMRPAIRLNATSDLAYERFAPWLFRAFPKVMFYDYTKVANRMGGTPRNYHLTFSRSETNDHVARELLDAGHNVAIVFAVTPSGALPKSWNGHRVIDGDLHDYRPADRKGCVVGLRAKGRAKDDASGFVVRS